MTQVSVDRGRVKFRGPDGRLYLWRVPTTREELGRYFRTFFGYTLAPTVHPDCVSRGHSSPLDVAWSLYSARDYRTGDPMSMAVLKGSRGLAGKSTLLAGVSTLEGLAGMDGVIVGGSAAQSKRVHDVGTEIWDHRVKIGDVLYEQPLRHLIEDPTSMETRFVVSGAKRNALTASSRSVRSPHPHRLRLDEVDEMALKIFEDSMGQTSSSDEARKPIQTVASSTHQHPRGTFTHVLQQASEKGWPVYEVCFKENLVENGGWLTPTLVASKRSDMSARAWQVEVELQEPAPEGRAIESSRVQAAFDPRYGTFSGREGELLEFPCCRMWTRADGPHGFHAYAIGADWAQRRDWTTVAIYRTDVSPWWKVAWLRLGRRPWPEMLARVNALRTRYHSCPMAHDATGMGGNMADDFLTVDGQGVTLSGTLRDRIFADYIVAIEQGELLGARITFEYQEHLYVTNRDLYSGGDRGHPPDSFIAGALAWHLHQQGLTQWTVSSATGADRLAPVRTEEDWDPRSSQGLAPVYG